MKQNQLWITLFRNHLIQLQITCVMFLGIISYANSLSVPMQYDDFPTLRIATVNILEAKNLVGLIGKSRLVVDLSFALNRYVHGEQVFGYHLLNLAIHLSSAIIVYMFVRLSICSIQQTYQLSTHDEHHTFLLNFIPLTVAALFVCHPVQTQAVTYIAQRYTTLSVLLYLCSLLAFLSARISRNLAKDNKLFLLWISASSVFAFLAMNSKEIAFTIPLMIAVLEFTLFRGYLLKNKYFIVLLSGLCFVIPLQRFFMLVPRSFFEILHGLQRATTETSVISRSDYFLTQLNVVLTYIRLLIIPINLNLDYDYPIYTSLFDPAVLSALAVHLLLISLAIYLLMSSSQHLEHGNKTKGTVMRLSFLGIAWFYVALSVESSVIPIRDVIYEHRIYLPSIGFFIATAACLGGVAAYGITCRKTIYGFVALLCIVFTICSIARNRIWSDEMVMWQDVLSKSPNKARVRYNVGFLYYKKIMPDKALPYLVRALELDRTRDQYWLTLNAAISLFSQYEGRSSNGGNYLKSYDSIDEPYFIPWKAISLNNLGLAYEYLGNLFLARENYSKATIKNPSLDLAWYNLALISVQMNDETVVREAASKLATLNPLLCQSVEKILMERFKH